MTDRDIFEEKLHQVDTMITELQEFANTTLSNLDDIKNSLRHFPNVFSQADSYWIARTEIDCGGGHYYSPIEINIPYTIQSLLEEVGIKVPKDEVMSYNIDIEVIMNRYDNSKATKPCNCVSSLDYVGDHLPGCNEFYKSR